MKADAAPPPAVKLALERMKTRADFLNVQAEGCRQSRPGLMLEVGVTPGKARRAGAIRTGFTASRKVGGAVERNRAKRRLREAARAVLPLYAREGHDYVLVARTATLTRPFAALLEDLATALAGSHAALDRKSATRVKEA
jgi:ribonuclease P protein component